MKKNSISQIENGINALTEQLLVSICREFNVNEEWLRTGKGEKFSCIEQNATDCETHDPTYLMGEKGSFKERLLFALSKLDESDWKVLERIANDLIKEKDQVSLILNPFDNFNDEQKHFFIFCLIKQFNNGLFVLFAVHYVPSSVLERTFEIP